MGIDKENEDETMLTVTEAAEQANVTQAAIRNAIYRGKLPAKQVYGRLLIEREEFAKFRSETKMGRPKQTKTEADAVEETKEA